MFYTLEHLDTPCTFWYPLYVQTTPCMFPMLPCASACSRGDLHVVGGCRVSSFCLDTPMCLDASPSVQHPHAFIHSPACLYVLGLLHVLWGNIPYVGELGGSAHLSGFWCLSVHPTDVHYASSCTFLVAHYVSSLYFHHYGYLSSSDCGVFWYVISTTGDHGSMFNRASYNIGSVWCGSAATPDPKRLWRCSWPCLCATAANPIFNASLDLCQLCHGFSTGRFLSQSQASHHFVYYMFGVCSGVCFLLSGAMLDAISTLRGSTIGVCTIATSWSLSVEGICATWWWSSAHTRYAQSGCSFHYIE